MGSRWWRSGCVLGSNVAPGDYGQHYCTVYFQVAETVDLKCSHHKKEIVIMGHDSSVNR